MEKYTVQEDRVPTKETLQEAHRRIKGFIHHTPVLTSEGIDALIGAQLYFKCENFQKVGAFKARGALNAVLSLPKETLVNGLATHSSGNHAQAVAMAAQVCGVKAHIVMPATAPQVKRRAVLGYGASIIDCEATLRSREATLAEVIRKTKALFIPPFNDYSVIAGQGTAAMELFDELAEKGEHLDALFVPVGGGGLLCGTALSAHYFSPKTSVYAGEPLGADDAYRSFKAGKKIPHPHPSSIADGLLTGLGDKNFPIIQQHVKDIFTVKEEEIIAAMRLVWERMKIIIEPSCAVPLAAVLKNKALFRGQRIGLILTGGNVDVDALPF